MITELISRDDKRWDAFVRGHPAGTVYHHSAWGQVLAETYGYTPLHVAMMSGDGSQIEGILPFMLVNSALTGRRVVSLPFTAYCSPLLPEEHLQDAIRFAFERFSRVRYAELKFVDFGDPSVDQGVVDTPFVTQILRLDGDIDALFLSFHDTSVRQRVRRAQRSGLSFRLTTTESELREFYRLLVDVRRRHGLPPQPYAFYANMRRILTPGNLFELPVIEFDGKVVAAAVVLKGHSTWHLEYSASDPGLLKHGPNQLLIWECIKLAHGQGAKCFDFGRTALWDHPLLEFKDRWQAHRHPIRHYYFPREAGPRSWDDSSAGFMAHLNRRLPPLVLEWEGRLLYRHRG